MKERCRPIFIKSKSECREEWKVIGCQGVRDPPPDKILKWIVRYKINNAYMMNKYKFVYYFDTTIGVSVSKFIKRMKQFYIKYRYLFISRSFCNMIFAGVRPNIK